MTRLEKQAGHSYVKMFVWLLRRTQRAYADRLSPLLRSHIYIKMEPLRLRLTQHSTGRSARFRRV